MLEGELRSEIQLEDKDQKKEHVQKINDLNWSHAIAEFNSKIEKWENINDIGSCSINIKKAKRSQTKNPFVTLEIGIIDVDNDIAFKIGSKKCFIDFKVKKTSKNDRVRSRLQERKTNSNDLKIKDKQDDGFAKIVNEYGVMWYFRCNGGNKKDTFIPRDKYPSLSQIMTGL